MILPGKCKWAVQPVDRDLIRELVDKTPRFMPTATPAAAGSHTAWQIHYVYFARRLHRGRPRRGGTLGARLVDLETLAADLRRGLVG